MNHFRQDSGKKRKKAQKQKYMTWHPARKEEDPLILLYFAETVLVRTTDDGKNKSTDYGTTEQN